MQFLEEDVDEEILFTEDCARLQVAWADEGRSITAHQAQRMWELASSRGGQMWLCMKQLTNSDLVSKTKTLLRKGF